jgi:hypothetical protein
MTSSPVIRTSSRSRWQNPARRRWPLPPPERPGSGDPEKSVIDHAVEGPEECLETSNHAYSVEVEP